MNFSVKNSTKCITQLLLIKEELLVSSIDGSITVWRLNDGSNHPKNFKYIDDYLKDGVNLKEENINSAFVDGSQANENKKDRENIRNKDIEIIISHETIKENAKEKNILNYDNNKVRDAMNNNEKMSKSNNNKNNKESINVDSNDINTQSPMTNDIDKILSFFESSTNEKKEIKVVLDIKDDNNSNDNNDCKKNDLLKKNNYNEFNNGDSKNKEDLKITKINESNDPERINVDRKLSNSDDKVKEKYNDKNISLLNSDNTPNVDSNTVKKDDDVAIDCDDDFFKFETKKSNQNAILNEIFN